MYTNSTLISTFEVTSDAEIFLEKISNQLITIDCMCCNERQNKKLFRIYPLFHCLATLTLRPNICASCVTYLLPRMDPLLFQAALIDGAAVVKRLKMDGKSRTGIGTE